MKKITILLLLALQAQFTFSQHSGNANYQVQSRYPDKNIDISYPVDNNLYLSVKGLANVKADTYVAIFNTFQVGKTTEEVNDLMNKRINQAIEEIKLKKGVEIFIDMLSFVPVYEYETEKKIFSKRSFNEIPVGFELKKNIHIKFTDPNLFNDIISIMSKNEIYDLVKVDYFSNNLETVKKDLMNRAKVSLQEKLRNYEAILGTTLTTSEKSITEDSKVVFPMERYQAYQAYNSTSLNLKKPANVNAADKATTLYYQPIVDKEFDFVINPTVLEPVIQVMYEIKLKVSRDSKLKSNKEYMLVTPSGEVKTLMLGQ